MPSEQSSDPVGRQKTVEPGGFWHASRRRLSLVGAVSGESSESSAIVTHPTGHAGLRPPPKNGARAALLGIAYAGALDRVTPRGYPWANFDSGCGGVHLGFNPPSVPDLRCFSGRAVECFYRAAGPSSGGFRQWVMADPVACQTAYDRILGPHHRGAERPKTVNIRQAERAAREAAQNNLTARQSLERVAAYLGINPKLPTHVLAQEIEGALRVARAVRFLSRGVPGELRCGMCGDTEGGPWLVRDGVMICEACDDIRSRTLPGNCMTCGGTGSDPLAESGPCFTCRGTGRRLEAQ